MESNTSKLEKENTNKKNSLTPSSDDAGLSVGRFSGVKLIVQITFPQVLKHKTIKNRAETYDSTETNTKVTVEEQQSF